MGAGAGNRQVMFYGRRPEGLWTTGWVPGARGAAVEGQRGQGFCFYSAEWPVSGCAQRTRADLRLARGPSGCWVER